MATQLATSLSVQYHEWANVFILQNHSKFQEALSAVTKVPRFDAASDIFAQLLQVNLQLCVNALGGILPKDEHASAFRRIAMSAGSVGNHQVQIEAWLLMFDAFAIYREEATDMLTQLEAYMDVHTERRWLHRKGHGLIASGHLQEAYELWVPLVVAIPNQQSDCDDSLCALLIDFGRLSTELGKYNDAVDIYNQALSCARTAHNQGLALIRLSNALERMSRPAQADKRRTEYFHLIKKEYPTHCALCSGSFGKEPKFLLPCCKTVVHSECLRQIVSDIQEAETKCPFCATTYLISDVVDPTAVVGRKYKRTKRASGDNTPLVRPADPKDEEKHEMLEAEE